MPITIGRDSSAGLFGATFLSTELQVVMSGASYSGVLPAGESWTEIGFVDRSTVGDIMEVGIYDITGGVSGATLVASEQFTTTGSAGAQLTASITPVGKPGNTYAVACRPVGGDCSTYRNSDSGESRTSTLDGTSALAASWTDNGGGNNYVFGAFANSTAAAGASIDSSDAQGRLGGSVSYTVSSFGSTINDTDINDGTFEVEATSENDTSAAFPGLSHGLVIPQFGAGRTLQVSDGTDTDTATIEFLPPSGYTHQAVGTVSGGLAEKDWAYTLSNLDNTDLYVTRDADTFVTHSNDGTSAITAAGTTEVWGWDSTDGKLTRIEITYNAQGEVVSSSRGDIVQLIITDIVKGITYSY